MYVTPTIRRLLKPLHQMTFDAESMAPFASPIQHDVRIRNILTFSTRQACADDMSKNAQLFFILKNQNSDLVTIKFAIPIRNWSGISLVEYICDEICFKIDTI